MCTAQLTSRLKGDIDPLGFLGINNGEKAAPPAAPAPNAPPGEQEAKTADISKLRKKKGSSVAGGVGTTDGSLSGANLGGATLLGA